MSYEVCLSFTGEDIRKTFLSHLVHSLDRKGIRSFICARSYHSGFRIAGQSRVAIFIISKDYTSLDLWVAQMARIIAYMEAVPVFLRVNPLDVLRVLNLAEDSAGIDERRRNALEAVKNCLDGHVTRKSCFQSGDWDDESQLVDKITCFVSDFMKQDFTSGDNKYLSLNWARSPELDSSYSFHSRRRARSLGHRSELSQPMLSSQQEEAFRGKAFVLVREPVETINMLSWWDQLKIKINPFVKHTRPSETIESSSTTTYQVSCGDDLPGMNQHIEQVLIMLRGDSTKEVHTIGICGVEGVGKTTLARFVYEEMSPQFQHHFFIKNFSKQGRSLFEIIAGESLETTTTSFMSERSRDVIRDMVGRKVLLVADSVDDIEQLKSLAKEVSLFGPGSRVIVITNDRSLLVQCGVKHIYEVGCLKYEEAIQLFSHFAYAPSDTLPLSHGLISRAVEVAGCIPLALKLLGSFLYGKDGDQWKSTLRLLEASHNRYSEEALSYIGAYDFKPVGSTIQELEENEANRYPLYSFTLQ